MTSTQPAVILVHGATLNGRSWDPVRRLIDPRLRVLAPDLPGHGARRAEPYTLQGGVDTVLAAARELGDAPFIVAGDSLGSYTAQAAAAALPYAAKSMMFRVLLPLLGEDKLIARKIPDTLRECGMGEEDIASTMAAGISLRVFPQAVAALRGFDFRARLARITQPTMFINGDDDTNHVRGEARYVACAQQASVHRFADCDHGVSLRRSPEYAELLNDFARRVLPG